MKTTRWYKGVPRETSERREFSRRRSCDHVWIKREPWVGRDQKQGNPHGLEDTKENVRRWRRDTVVRVRTSELPSVVKPNSLKGVKFWWNMQQGWFE